MNDKERAIKRKHAADSIRVLIEEIKIRCGYNTEEIAKWVGISPRTLTNYYSNPEAVPYKVILDLCELVGKCVHIC